MKVKSDFMFCCHYNCILGHEIFKSHAHLLRGGIYSLWRQDRNAIKDLETVLSLPNLPPEVIIIVYLIV